MSVRIGETVGHVGFEFLSARLVAINAGVGIAQHGRPRRFNGRVHERAFLEVERSARIEGEAVGGVMRVGRVDAVEDADSRVAMIAAGAVLEKHHIGRFGQQHAAVVELEACRAMQMVGENRAFVGVASALGVFENQELIVHFLFRLPVRIGRPGGHP